MAIKIWVGVGWGIGLLPEGNKTITWTNVDLSSTGSVALNWFHIQDIISYDELKYTLD